MNLTSFIIYKLTMNFMWIWGEFQNRFSTFINYVSPFHSNYVSFFLNSHNILISHPSLSVPVFFRITPCTLDFSRFILPRVTIIYHSRFFSRSLVNMNVHSRIWWGEAKGNRNERRRKVKNIVHVHIDATIQWVLNPISIPPFQIFACA